eukprot:6837768-Pyramimonas_sp.AAC.1
MINKGNRGEVRPPTRLSVTTRCYTRLIKGWSHQPESSSPGASKATPRAYPSRGNGPEASGRKSGSSRGGVARQGPLDVSLPLSRAAEIPFGARRRSEEGPTARGRFRALVVGL